MDHELKKRIKHLDQVLAILTFACAIVFISAAVIAIVLIKQIYFK